MLARRMLTFVAVLLALTALAAAFAPPPPRNIGSIGNDAPAVPDVAGNDTVDRKLDASKPGQTTITLQQGDRLHLEVTSDDLDAVELVGLAQVRAVAPEGIAMFDVIGQEPGTYPIKLTISDRVIGVVEVTPPRRSGLAPAEPLIHRTRDT